MKLMVMAGTTEGVEIIKKLAKIKEINITATTVTHQGADLASSAGADVVIDHALDEEGIEEVIQDRRIDVLVDATHPFAADATRNAIKAADASRIEYIRFERPSIAIPDDDLIYQVNSFEEASLKALELTKGRILHLAGVMTLKYLEEQIDPQKIVVRVLPSVYSVGKCREFGIPAVNIVAMQGTFSKEFNKALMKEYNISLVLTKESGEAGGTPSKIEAALELGIPVVIVMRREVRELENKRVYQDLNKLVRYLVRLCHL